MSREEQRLKRGREAKAMSKAVAASPVPSVAKPGGGSAGGGVRALAHLCNQKGVSLYCNPEILKKLEKPGPGAWREQPAQPGGGRSLYCPMRWQTRPRDVGGWVGG